MEWLTFQTKRALVIWWYDTLSIKVLRLILTSLGLLGLGVLVLAYFSPLASWLVAVSLMLLAISLMVGSVHLYLIYLKSHPWYLISDRQKAASPLNHFDFLTLKVLWKWRAGRTWLALWRELLQIPEVAIIFYRLGLSAANIQALLPTQAISQEAVDEFVTALSQTENDRPLQLLTVFDLINHLSRRPELQKLFQQLKVEQNTVDNLLNFYHQQVVTREKIKQAWLENPPRTGGFAKSWSVAYTNFLDLVTREITASIAVQAIWYPIYRRGELLPQLVSALNRTTGQHLLLVGELGIGKKTLFYHLANQITHYQTRSPLDGWQVRVLDVQRLLSIITTPTQLPRVIEQLMTDLVKAANVVMFVDNFDLLLNPSGEAGTANLGTLLANYLPSSQFRLVGTLPNEAYIQAVRTHPTLSEHFTAVEVPPPTHDELEMILLSHLTSIEQRYKVFFTLRSLNLLISLAQRYLKDVAPPLRGINLSEEIAAWAAAQNVLIITDLEVKRVIEQKVKVPLQVMETERQTLLNLASVLHQRIIGQDEAIKQLSDALLRARAGLTTGERPIGCFLFLGPTGVGKTETAKALAEIYFGSEVSLIRLDMTEYADDRGLEKLLGSDPITKPGSLTVAIQNHPSAVLLLDELEKASPPVKNALLPLLDEGRLTTNFGRVLDFTNTIIIATSNALADFIKDQISSGVAIANFQKALSDKLIQEKIFTPELLNRFDGIIVYSPLSVSQVRQVVGLQLGKLEKNLLRDKGVTLEVAPAVIDDLVSRGYDPVFGARALQRVIKNELETRIAREMIAAQPQPGSRLIVKSLT